MTQSTVDLSANNTASDDRRRNKGWRVLLHSYFAYRFAGLGVANTDKNETPKADAGASYSDDIIKTYDFKFGKDSRLRVWRKSETGGFHRTVYTRDYCAKCPHQECAEIRPRMPNSFPRPILQKECRTVNQHQGIEYSRHCEGCSQSDSALFRLAHLGFKVDV